jgi:cysteine desulfurase/selenocysteine lyase
LITVKRPRSLAQIIAPALATGSRELAPELIRGGGSERCPLSGLADAISISSMNLPNLAYSMGWRERIAGLAQPVPLADGRLAPYINLDNAATTPPLQEVLDAVHEFLPYYSSVHRGAGFKSRVSTAAYDQAHETIAQFVGADPSTNIVIFGKNTTEAINKLAYRYPLGRRNIVLSTGMEHHSNDLPWRGRARVVRARVTDDGRLDEDDVDRLIAAFGDRIALLTVSGASNVTGFVQPIHRLARKAHAVGASILVDAAQLAPHRRIDVRPDHDPEHLDFVAFSAHKMYAPFGTGALVGRRDIFLEGVPEYQGGGTVEVVTPTEVRWAGLPDREEAGTPNVVGAVAMAAAARVLMAADMDALEHHEASLTTYALERLQSLPGITIYGESDPSRCPDRVGVIPFNLDKPHALVAAILGYEGGIGVRSGCFCAQPYVAHLLGRAESEPGRWLSAPPAGDRSPRPGMVRVSLGAYNTSEDVDVLVELLGRIIRNDYRGQYCYVPDSSDYRPVGYQDVVHRLAGQQPAEAIV